MPFVLIQLVMVALVIAFPQMVLASLDSGPKVDPSKIQITVPEQNDQEIPQLQFK